MRRTCRRRKRLLLRRRREMWQDDCGRGAGWGRADCNIDDLCVIGSPGRCCTLREMSMFHALKLRSCAKSTRCMKVHARYAECVLPFELITTMMLRVV